MPKYNLEFDILNHSDLILYNRAIKSSDLVNALYEINSLDITLNEKITSDLVSITDVMSVIRLVIARNGINFGELYDFTPQPPQEKVLLTENTNQFKLETNTNK